MILLEKIELTIPSNIKDIEARIKNKYANDEFFKSVYQKLALTNDNMHLLDVIDVMESISKCRDCPGLSACPQDNKGYILTIVDNVLVKQPCLKMQEQLKLAQSHKALIYTTELSARKYPNIKDIEISSDSRTLIINHIMDLAEGLSNKGVYLYGPPGIGKTFIIEALLQKMLDNNITSAYVLLNDLAAKIRTNFYSNSEDKTLFTNTINKLKRVNFLYIDDIGAEVADNGFTRDEILFPILDYRMKNNLTTCFSSNYSLLELKEHYARTNSKLNEPVKAARLLERIRVLSDEYEIIESQSRR